jgi:hypothetical protein
LSIRLSVVIVHDRRRAAMAAALLAEVERQRAMRKVWPCEITGVRLSDDGSGHSPWVGLKCALAAECWAHRQTPSGEVQSPTHVLILEDDAAPAPGSLAASVRACITRPNDVLYLSATKEQAGAHMMRELDGPCPASWVYVTGMVVGTVATIIPVHVARRFLDWASDVCNECRFIRERPEAAGDGDARLTQYLVDVCGVAQVVSTWSVWGHGAAQPADSLVARKEHPFWRPAYNGVHGLPKDSVLSPVSKHHEPGAASLLFNVGLVDARDPMHWRYP